MKKYIASLAVSLLFATAFVNCSDWTEPETRKMVEYENTEIAKTEEYYQALREWKASDHSISFGWFSGWGEGSVSTGRMLSALPDSMGMVSIWDNALAFTPAKLADLRYVQQVKGTKVLMCTFIQWVGKGFTPPEYDVDEATREAFWGWKEEPVYNEKGEVIKWIPIEADCKIALAKYSQAIFDTINKYGYDGLDIDFEPNIDGVYGKLDQNPEAVKWFLDILCTYLGPKSNSGKMLVLDGELWNIPPSTATYFNYYIAQAYSVSGGAPSPTAGTSESSMESRLNQIIRAYGDQITVEEVTNKFIVTENLESAINALDGGYFWTTRDGVRQDKAVCPSLLGMAKWEPANGFRKGGFGGYRFDAEAVNKPAYKWMRRGIQAQTPALITPKK